MAITQQSLGPAELPGELLLPTGEVDVLATIEGAIQLAQQPAELGRVGAGPQPLKLAGEAREGTRLGPEGTRGEKAAGLILEASRPDRGVLLPIGGAQAGQETARSWQQPLLGLSQTRQDWRRMQTAADLHPAPPGGTS